ncbi:MAG: hypothetical protein ISQ52_08665 [Synechococcus sp. BS307-5m-G38]|nr:hypothetical protein [Synechococcus sp. BS307-5m-G38]
MLRLLLLGLLLVGIATGLRQQWLVLDWTRMLNDLGMPFAEDGKPIDFNRLIMGVQELD